MAARESAKFAQELIAACCEQQGIVPGQLTAHADRGSPMIAKSTAQLYFDLGVAKSHSRPRTSNDNPYSESNFRTIKYRPEMPEQFGSLEHARQVVRDLVDWYNEEHYHVGLALLHPVDVRYGRTDQIVEARQRVLDAAHHRHPERFVRGCPKQKAPSSGAWINPPAVDQIAYAARTQEVIPELDAHGQRWEVRLGHVVLGGIRRTSPRPRTHPAVAVTPLGLGCPSPDIAPAVSCPDSRLHTFTAPAGVTIIFANGLPRAMSACIRQ